MLGTLMIYLLLVEELQMLNLEEFKLDGQGHIFKITS
jgi:hypothetical protein